MPTVAVLILLLTLGTDPAGPTRPQPATDYAALDLAWTDLTGRDQKLESYRGRTLVLNFWATWCIPCRDELPELVELQNRYGIHGVQVVAAAADSAEQRPAVMKVAREFDLNFPVLLGANTAQMKSLGLGEAIPATVIVDAEGRIVERVSGVFELKKLERILDGLVDPGDPLRRAALDQHPDDRNDAGNGPDHDPDSDTGDHGAGSDEDHGDDDDHGDDADDDHGDDADHDHGDDADRDHGDDDRETGGTGASLVPS